MSDIASELHIKDFKLAVFLGWPDEERLREQEVLLNINIHLPKPPTACETDQLQDTFCYHQLVNLIREKTRGQHFHLVEHLAREIFHLLQPILPGQTKLVVSITKHPASIKELIGGVCFRYGNIT